MTLFVLDEVQLDIIIEYTASLPHSVKTAVSSNESWSLTTIECRACGSEMYSCSSYGYEDVSTITTADDRISEAHSEEAMHFRYAAIAISKTFMEREALCIE